MKKSNIKSTMSRGKFWLLAEITIITSLAGIIYQLLDEGFADFRAIIMGGSLGIAFWAIELFILSGWRKRFLKLPLLATIFIKGLVYLLIIFIVSNLLGLIIGTLQGKHWEEFVAAILDRDQQILMAYTLAVYVLLAFHMQINFLLGEGVLIKFLLGKYQKPTNEHRIFMFLDLKSSTTIAEKLGLVQYYSFLNDFFHELTEPVRETQAEIYQYVGDEVVFTWKTKEGLIDNNCLDVFFKVRDKVKKSSKYYNSKYGVTPEFKAGLHFGDVITAQIGDIKREIVYNGDVLNTAARIQEQCNKLDRELLISGALLNQLDIKNRFQEEEMDSLQLRGKERFTNLYSIVQS